jgi:putative transposase
MAIIQLSKVFDNFFRKRARNPRLRKKGIDDRLTLTDDQFRVEGSRIRMPHIGWVQMRESLRFKCKIMSAWSFARLIDGWSQSLLKSKILHAWPKLKTKARSLWIWVSRRLRRSQREK